MAETGSRMGMKVILLAVFCLAILWAGASTASAAYVHKYGSSFPLEPAGTPGTVAVDEESGSVYTLTSEGILEKFDAAGAPSNFSAPAKNWVALKCGEECKGLAVDNSGGPNQGVIYVGSTIFYESGVNDEEAAVEAILPTGTVAGLVKKSSSPDFRRMCGVGVGPKGELYVAVASFPPLIDRYQPKGWAANPTQEPAVTATIEPTDHFNPCKMTVDSQANIYWGQGAGAESANGLFKYGPSAFGSAGKGTGTEEAPTPSVVISSGVSASSADTENDDVYVDHVSSIERLDSTGASVETFGESPHVTNSFGAAVNGSTKTVYVANKETNDISIYPKFPAPDIFGLTAIADVESAILTAHVDPAGAGDITACTFEYREKEAGSFTPIPCEQTLPYEDATDVTASLTGLSEGIDYEFKLTVETAGASSTKSATFRIAPPSLEGVFPTDVGETQATLNARIHPHNAATEYFFEYGPTPAYGQVVPVPAGLVAGGTSSGTLVSVVAKGLDGRVTYHFRVVAESPLGRVTSDDQTFNFFPQECPNSSVRQETGSDFLPDCRAYELVTPSNQGNAILNVGILATPPSYATNPTRFAFGAVAGAITGTEAVNGPNADAYVATRTSTGWVTALPGLHGNQTSGVFGVWGSTADIGLNRFIEWGERVYPIDPEGEKEGFEFRENLPYVFNADGSFVGRWPTGGSAITHAEGMNGYFQPSPDFSHLAFTSSNVAFAPNGVLEGPGSAYDFNTVTGETEIISRLPSAQGGGSIPQQASISEATPESDRIAFEKEEAIGIPGIANGNGRLQTSPTDTKNPAKVNPGVSTDGSHILMSTSSAPYNFFTSFEAMPPIHIYMRVNDIVTYDVSKGDRVQYVGMTANGSRVFFLSDEQLTADDNDSSADLFMWEEETDELAKLSAGSGNGDVDSCNPTWTSQCDVSVPVYSGGSIPDTPLSSAKGDIYFYSPEQLDGTRGVPDGRNLYLYREGSVQFVATAQVTRMNVSPDGEHMAMITHERLTGYDNEGFAEMYSYEPSAEKLICVSCNPRGLPPLKDVEGAFMGLFMANDGRTFFYSLDALVPKDTNQLRDVYEYVDGRPQLISTGTGAHDRTLNQSGDVRSRAGLSAVSADGVNVYFDTYETLVPQDENGQFLKYYDARTGGGFPTDAPLQPCVAADECHGDTSSPAPPTGIVSDGGTGGSGNVRHGKRVRQKRRKSHRKKTHRHGRRQAGRHDNGRRSNG
jgi:hypothetical protein